jgi:hypothetical protein
VDKDDDALHLNIGLVPPKSLENMNLADHRSVDVADSSVPLNAKRNRGGRCLNPAIHDPHDTCPGRERAAKTERPVDPAVSLTVHRAWYMGKFRLSRVNNRSAIGIISNENRELYALDLESYEGIPYDQEHKFISFFTAVKRTNDIILDYAAQDLLPLTLRQIHYQMVVRHKDYPNTKISYDHLAADLVQARLSGLVPWNAIDDPTRGLHDRASWDSIQERLESAARSHHINRWTNQQKWPMVLVEKDAALGIISRACDDLDVPFASMKGYGSLSALRNQVANHCLRALNLGKEPVIIHLSDHDATGHDMERNLTEYLDKLVRQSIDVRHVALTLEQIKEGYGDGNALPPDPVKTKDPRRKKYLEYLNAEGIEEGAWEMDALRPDVLHNIIVNEIKSCCWDEGAWQEVEDQEQEQKQTIHKVVERWDSVLEFVKLAEHWDDVLEFLKGKA